MLMSGGTPRSSTASQSAGSTLRTGRLREADEDDDLHRFMTDLSFICPLLRMLCMSLFQLNFSREAKLTRANRSITRGNPFKLSVNYCRTNKRKNFFSERVVKV